MSISLADTARSAWLDLLWSSWRSLGVRASHARLTDVMIDPETLIIATAGLTMNRDARVRAHAMYWCIHNHRVISTARLKRLTLSMAPELTGPFRHFAATVNATAGTRWPDDGVVPDVYDISEVPEIPMASLDPALLKVRVRLLMGANARSEVMATCLANPDTHFELRMLETLTTFARRHLADPVADLARGGWLNHSILGNRHRYVCSERAREAFGTAGWIDWPRRFELLASTIQVSEHLDEQNALAALARIRAESDLWRDEARLEIPGVMRAGDLPADRLGDLRSWTHNAIRVLTAIK